MPPPRSNASTRSWRSPRGDSPPRVRPYASGTTGTVVSITSSIPSAGTARASTGSSSPSQLPPACSPTLRRPQRSSGARRRSTAWRALGSRPDSCARMAPSSRRAVGPHRRRSPSDRQGRRFAKPVSRWCANEPDAHDRGYFEPSALVPDACKRHRGAAVAHRDRRPGHRDRRTLSERELARLRLAGPPPAPRRHRHRLRRPPRLDDAHGPLRVDPLDRSGRSVHLLLPNLLGGDRHGRTRPVDRGGHFERTAPLDNPRHWRALHWLAYGSWPIALAHALGMGTDARLSWVQGLVG